ncbi:MAG: hypothetical protein MO852_00700 [Candidatus Devosia euplotis]|nr:hypothetical protein [Candidatus Devosia euplotis]
MASLLGNIRLTVAITAMTICSIAIAIGAVVAGLFVSLSGAANADVAKALSSATRITAQILSVNLSSLEVVLDAQDNVASLIMRSMPWFRNDGVIDAVAGVSAQDASIYVFDAEVSPILTSVRQVCSCRMESAWWAARSPPARRCLTP